MFGGIIMSRASRKAEATTSNNFTPQLKGKVPEENLAPLTTESTKTTQLDNIKGNTNRTATANQTFVIRPELKELLDDLVYLPNSHKRRPGTKGILSDIANDGMARELYRKNLITKDQMNAVLRK